MSENKEYMTHPEELGCIHISEEVLASLSAGAVAEVEGVSGLMNVAPKKSGTRGGRPGGGVGGGGGGVLKKIR